jgi:hypothetical protein
MARRGRATPTAPARMTKAERKEQARKERLELLRKQEQRKRRRRVGIIVGVVVAAGAIAAAVLLGGGSGGSSTSCGGSKLPGMLCDQATAAHPWPANSQDALARANDIGLPALGNETFHHHDLLQIFVHGDTIPVPPLVGLTSTGGASMHTHDTSGIMHLESDKPFNFTLGEFFDVWGVRFSDSCIGGYCSSGPNQLRVYVNGKQITTDVTKISLTQHEDVVVTYGTTAQLPNPIPKTYPPNISKSCGNSC